MKKSSKTAAPDMPICELCIIAAGWTVKSPGSALPLPPPAAPLLCPLPPIECEKSGPPYPDPEELESGDAEMSVSSVMPRLLRTLRVFASEKNRSRSVLETLVEGGVCDVGVVDAAGWERHWTSTAAVILC